jgi:hypothetical protein
MYIGPLATFIYILATNGRKSLFSKILPMALFFVILFVCSYLSIYFFPLNGDELMYDHYSNAFSTFMKQGVFSGFEPENDFLKIGALIYLIGDGSYLSLISFNGFLLYAACDLYIRSLPDISGIQTKILNFSLFAPPILYLGLRPAKEASVVLLLSLVFFIWKTKNIFLRAALILLTLPMFWSIRWQYIIGVIGAVLVFLAWRGFFALEKKTRQKVLIASIVFLAILTPIYFSRVQAYLNFIFFKPDNVYKYAHDPKGAFIYKLMLYKNGENSLHPWNVFVAQIGGFFTPHPLRLIREYLRDSIWNADIVEEFLFVTFWFFTLIPVYCLFFKDKVLAKFKDINGNTGLFFFHFAFIAILCFFACMTLLFQTPQSFRYKMPLNVYLFITIIYYVNLIGFKSVIEDLTKNKRWLTGYLGFMLLYSVVYMYSVLKF